MKNNIVIIPVYKTAPDASEVFSLKQGLSVLGNHEIAFICPKSLDVKYYVDYCRKLSITPSFERFDDRYFTGIPGYNELMLSTMFYKYFSSYSYMLIYQLDALVFSDKLDFWCDTGYDFIGAPWFENFAEGGDAAVLSQYAGNGGLSLRNIGSVLEILEKIDHVRFSPIKEQKFLGKKRYLKACFRSLKKQETLRETVSRRDLNEDFILTRFFADYFTGFKVAPSSVAIDFSFEFKPAYLYELNNNNLPFGCHAFLKYDFSFWKTIFRELGIWDESLNIY